MKKYFWRDIRKHPEKYWIIHYSSESLFDAAKEANSPRVTSIAVLHFETDQAVSVKPPLFVPILWS